MYLIIDLEATCWERGAGHYGENEIIEIGATVIGDDYEIVKEIQQFVRPVRNPILSEFCKKYNDATAAQAGRIVPVIVHINEDRSFSIEVKTPKTSALLREAAGIGKGSGTPNGTHIAAVTRDQLRRIAETKMPDLNAASVEGAMKTVEGTARSMGIKVAG